MAALVWRCASGRIARRALGELRRPAGYKDLHVPHGWRSSFASIMNERVPSDSRMLT
jgi:hypothetical protein